MSPETYAQMVALFAEDANAQADALAECLLRLAEHPTDESLLERAYRAAHTIKGSASMLAVRAGEATQAAQLDTISHLAHIVEGRVERAVSGEHPLNDAVISHLREVPGLLKAMLRECSAEERDECRKHIAQLEALLQPTDSLPEQEPPGNAVEPLSQDDLGALFEADASAQRALITEEQLSAWLAGHVPPDEAAPELPEEQVLAELEQDTEREAEALPDEAAPVEEMVEVEDEMPLGAESLEAFRGELPPPPPPSAPPAALVEEEDREAIDELLEEEIGVSRQRGPTAPEKQKPPGSESVAPANGGQRPLAGVAEAAAPEHAEEDGEIVLKALAYILGLEEEAPPAPAKPEPQGTVAPSAGAPTSDQEEPDTLTELLGLEEEASASEGRAKETPPPEAKEAPPAPAKPEPQGTVAPSAGAPTSDQEEPDTLAELLGLEEEASASEGRAKETPPPEAKEAPPAPATPEPQGTVAPSAGAPTSDQEEPDTLAELLGLEEEASASEGRAKETPPPKAKEAVAEAPPALAKPESQGTVAALAGAPAPPEEPVKDDPMRLIFLEEARQLLDDLNHDLVILEQSPRDAEVLHRVLRAAHTLKGSAATVGYEKIRAIAHRMEDVLQLVRDQGSGLSPDAVDVLLAAADRIDELTKEIFRRSAETGDIAEIVGRLESVHARLASPVPAAPPVETALESVIGIPEQPAAAEADSLREVFIEEARELLDVLGRDLVTLEQHPGDAGVVNRAMRTAHTLKGSAAMLGYDRIRTLAHAMEDALQVIRDAQIGISADAVDLMLSAADILERHVKSVARTGKEDQEEDVQEPAGRLRALASELAGKALGAPEPVQEAGHAAMELEETFLEEFHAWQTSLTQALVALELNPADHEARQRFLDNTVALTGSAAALHHEQIAQVAGHMDAIMQAAKERGVPLEAEALDALGEAMEVLGALFTALRTEQHDRTPDASALIARLKEVRVAGSAVAPPTPPPPPPRKAPAAEVPVDNRRGGRRIIEVDLDRLNQLMNLAAELVISRTRLSTELLRLGGVVTELSEQGHRLTSIERKLAELGAAGRRSRTSDEGVLRGFTEGEFDRFSDIDVLIRDLRDSSAVVTDLGNDFGGMATTFDQNITRISTIAKDLHDEILRVRMVHFERAFTRIPRIIRDAARGEGKQFNLVLEGADTEIDKNILEAMNNPLLHLLRNTVSHGIEPPEERLARGKPAAGKVTVRAAQEGSHVVIEVSDDGRGIDPNRIRRAAVERKLLSEEQANALSDAEVIDLIFEPGLSTAEKVNELSGRGVGMDVVRSTVTRFNGVVSVDTAVGRGTTIRITLPLTLAIGQALLVQVNDRHFALPLASVSQIEQITPEQVVLIKDHPYIYRGDTPVPLILLGEALGMPDVQPLNGETRPVVIAQEGERQTALAVDRIVGREDIVIKTLGTHLRHVPGISGATILGDGSVVMILNVPYFLSAMTTAQRRASVTSARPGQQGGRSAARARRSRIAEPPSAKPPAEEAKQVLQPPPEKGAKQPPKKHRILIVDDSISIRKYVSGVLERGGYEAITANDGMDAWEKLQNQECGLVISDLEMPRMHGYELIAEIKKNARTRDIPVVFLTARAGEKHRRMGVELGAAAFLNKPFSEPELLHLIGELVS